MPKVVADCSEVRGCFIDGVSNKPAVCNVHLNIRCRLPKRAYPIQMLNKYDLEQYYRVNAWPAVIRAVQVFNQVIYAAKLHGCVYLSKKMFSWNQIIQNSRFQVYFCFLHSCSAISITLFHYTKKASLYKEA